MFDRVKQTATATGDTDPYLLGATAAGFRSFSDAFIGGADPATYPRVPYLAVMGDDWELGYGIYTPGGTPEISRDPAPVASSNSGAAVAWAAGEKEISAVHMSASSQNGARGCIAYYAPTSSDGRSAGYREGSLWIELDEYALGAPALGVWLCLGTHVVDAVEVPNWVNLAAQLSTTPLRTNGLVRYVAGLQTDELSWDFAGAPTQSVGVGAFDHAGGTAMATRAARLHGGERTVGATTATFACWFPRGAGLFSGTVIACPDTTVAADNLGAMWKVEGACRHDTSGVMEFVGTPVITLIYGDASLSTAALAASVATVGATKYLHLNGTGVAGLNLVWSFDIQVNQVFAKFG